MEDDLGFIKAAESGNLELVKMFASSGANINARDSFGATALMKACLQEQLELVRLLLDFGADVNIRDRAYGHHRPDSGFADRQRGDSGNAVAAGERMSTRQQR